MTMPSKLDSYIAEIPPTANPWRSAYIGAVIFALVGLKIVIIAAIKPPTSPKIINPDTELGSPELKNIFQVQAADNVHNKRYKPVLLTAPDRVMTSLVEKSDER